MHTQTRPHARSGQIYGLMRPNGCRTQQRIPTIMIVNNIHIKCRSAATKRQQPANGFRARHSRHPRPKHTHAHAVDYLHYNLLSVGDKALAAAWKFARLHTIARSAAVGWLRSVCICDNNPTQNKPVHSDGWVGVGVGVGLAHARLKGADLKTGQRHTFVCGP